MALTISEIAHGLECRSEGFWVSLSASEISYPEQGNDICFSMEESSFWFNHRNDCILAIARSFPPQGTFFDVGGGNGYVARAIQDAGFSAVVVEPGPAGARNAKKRGIACV